MRHEGGKSFLVFRLHLGVDYIIHTTSEEVIIALRFYEGVELFNELLQIVLVLLLSF